MKYSDGVLATLPTDAILHHAKEIANREKLAKFAFIMPQCTTINRLICLFGVENKQFSKCQIGYSIVLLCHLLVYIPC